MTQIELCKKIEIMRAELHDLIDQYGIGSDIVLNFSKELDKLLSKLENIDNDYSDQYSKGIIGHPTHR